MAKELFEDLREKELEAMEKVKVEIDEDSFKVTTGVCPSCNVKMEKIIENKNLFDGAITFHIIKFRCAKCGKKFLDIGQAQKYDLYSLLEKFSRKTTSNFGYMAEKLKLLVKV